MAVLSGMRLKISKKLWQAYHDADGYFSFLMFEKALQSPEVERVLLDLAKQRRESRAKRAG